MHPTFKIAIANDERNISISYRYEPRKMEDFVELFKKLMLVWGFEKETVDAYFELEDLIREHDEQVQKLENQIEEYRNEIERLKGRTFKMV